MNDIFEKIGKTISETGKVVGEKTKQVTDVAKLNTKIIAAEHAITDNYTILGKYYYDNMAADPAEDIAETVNSITASIESIAEMKAQLLSIKGAVKCQNCGSEAPVENDFCGKCGAKLEKQEPPVCECDCSDDACECCEAEEVTEAAASEETAETTDAE